MLVIIKDVSENYCIQIYNNKRCLKITAFKFTKQNKNARVAAETFVLVIIKDVFENYFIQIYNQKNLPGAKIINSSDTIAW